MTPARQQPSHPAVRESLLYVVLLAFLLLAVTLPNVLTRLDPLTGDEPFYVMTGISLLRDRDLDETNNYAQRDYDEFYPPNPLPADFRGWPGFPRDLPPHPSTSTREGLYTKHGIGLSLLIALPYEVAGRVAAVLVIMLCAALLAGQMYLLAREAGASVRLAELIAIGLIIAMPFGPYATLIFPEIPAALLLVYAVRRVASASNAPWQWLLAGSAIGFLPWLHQRFAPTAVVLSAIVLYRLARSGITQPVSLAFAPIAVGGSALVAYNLWLYGALRQPSADHAGFNWFPGSIENAFGLLLDAQWGLLVAAPVMLLALAAAPWWYLASRRTVQVALAAVAPYLVVVAAYNVWWGEWGPPARYLVPIAPFAAGALAAWLARASLAGRVVTGMLWGFGMLLTLIGYGDPQRFYHHPNGLNNLYTRLGELLRIDLAAWLVAFQPFTPGPVAARLWISLFTLLALLLTLMLTGSPVLQLARVARERLGSYMPPAVRDRG